MRIFEEIMVENFPHLMKDMNVNIPEAQRTPSRMNSETHIETHYHQTVETKKEYLESSKREATLHMQRNHSEILHRFLLRNLGAQKPVGQHKRKKKKQNNTKQTQTAKEPISNETVLQE